MFFILLNLTFRKDINPFKIKNIDAIIFNISKWLLFTGGDDVPAAEVAAAPVASGTTPPTAQVPVAPATASTPPPTSELVPSRALVPQYLDKIFLWIFFLKT